MGTAVLVLVLVLVLCVGGCLWSVRWILWFFSLMNQTISSFKSYDVVNESIEFF